MVSQQSDHHAGDGGTHSGGAMGACSGSDSVFHNDVCALRFLLFRHEGPPVLFIARTHSGGAMGACSGSDSVFHNVVCALRSSSDTNDGPSALFIAWGFNRNWHSAPKKRLHFSEPDPPDTRACKYPSVGVLWKVKRPPTYYLEPV